MDDCTPESCPHDQQQPLWREMAQCFGTLLRKLLHTPDQ